VAKSFQSLKSLVGFLSPKCFRSNKKKLNCFARTNLQKNKQSAIAMQSVSIFPLSVFLFKKEENLHSHYCLARSQKLFLFVFPKLCCEQGRNQLKLAFHFSLIQQPSAVIVFSSIIIFIFKLSKNFNYQNTSNEILKNI
jgi:hypothetical protein